MKNSASVAQLGRSGSLVSCWSRVQIPPEALNPFRKSVDGKGLWRNRVVFGRIFRLVKTRIYWGSVTKFRNAVTIFRNVWEIAFFHKYWNNFPERFNFLLDSIAERARADLRDAYFLLLTKKLLHKDVIRIVNAADSLEIRLS